MFKKSRCLYYYVTLLPLPQQNFNVGRFSKVTVVHLNKNKLFLLNICFIVFAVGIGNRKSLFLSR